MTEFRTNLDARVQLYLNAYEIATNTAGNYSIVRANLQLIRISGTGRFSANTNNSWSVNIDGQTAGGSGTYDVRSGSQDKGTWDFAVSHNADGTRTINVSGSFSDPSGNVASGSTGGQLGLSTIPRASTASFPNGSTFAAGSTVVIWTNRASGSFTHDIDYYFGNKSGRAITNTGDGGNWAVPIDLLTEIPNSPTGVGRIHTTTYNNGSYIGETDTYFTLTTPSTAVPSFSAVTGTEAVTSIANDIGALVKNKSKLNVAISNDAAGYQGSTIVSYQITVAGQTIPAQSGQTAVLGQSGTVTLTGTVTDSRGMTFSRSINLNVLDYSPPAITAYSSIRTDGVGTPAINGTTIKTALTAAVSSLVNGSQKNTLTWTIKTKLNSDTTAWSAVVPTRTINATGISYNDFQLLNGFPVANSYRVYVEVTDKLGTTSGVEMTVGTGGVLLHLSTAADRIGVGKYAEDGRGSVDAAEYMYQRNGKRVLDVDDMFVPGRGNVLDNCKFRINQRNYVTPLVGATPPSTYTFDRWRTETPARISYINMFNDPATAATANGYYAVANVTVDFTDTSWSATNSGRTVALSSPTNVDSYLYVPGSGTMVYGEVAGKTYTLSATGRVKTAFTGTTIDNGADTRERRLLVIANGVIIGRSAAVPNVVGQATRVSVTFTLPAGTTSVSYRWYLGNTAGAIQWTAMRLSETQTWTGADNTSYFDGSGPQPGVPEGISTGKWVYTWIGALANPGNNGPSMAEWFPVAATASRYNRVHNPHLNNDSAGWASYGNINNGVTPRQLPSGTMPDGSNIQTYANAAYFYQLSGGSIPARGGGIYIDQNDNGGLTPGKEYAYSVYVSTSDTRAMTTMIQPYDARSNGPVGPLLINSTPTTTAPGVWRQIQQRITVPAGADRLRIHIVSDSAAIPNGTTLAATLECLVESTGTTEDWTFFDGDGHTYPVDTSGDWSYLYSDRGFSAVSRKVWAAGLGYGSVAGQQGATVTIKSGHSIQQVVEQLNVSSGTWTLSWTGTAQGRVYNRSSAPNLNPSYAASPVTVTLDGTDDVMVEFTSGTLYDPQLERGSKVTIYPTLRYSEELRNCQRYYWRRYFPLDGQEVGVGTVYVTTPALYVPVFNPVVMRITPSVGVIGAFRAHTPGVAITTGTNVVAQSWMSNTPEVWGFQLNLASGSGFANGGAAHLQASGSDTNRYIEALAEF